MTKFLLTYTTSTVATEPMTSSNPESAQTEMDAWNAWAARCGAHLIDFGAPLGNGQTVTGAGAGPSSGGVTGYSLVGADSMDEAVALLDGHPFFADPGAAIDVYESLPM
jgi:hypothetical protein